MSRVDHEDGQRTSRVADRELVRDRLLSVAVGAAVVIAALTATWRVIRAIRGEYRVAPAVLMALEDWQDFGTEGIWLGAQEPTVKIVEFFDVRCSICARAVPWVLQQLSDPEVAVVVRHFPSADSTSAKGAVALECAHAQGKAPELLQVIAENRPELESKEWSEWAELAGVSDGVLFSACVEDQSVQERPRVDSLAAASLGIPGTPTFIINDMMITGFGGGPFMDRLVADAKAEAQRQDEKEW